MRETFLIIFSMEKENCNLKARLNIKQLESSKTECKETDRLNGKRKMNQIKHSSAPMKVNSISRANSKEKEL